LVIQEVEELSQIAVGGDLSRESRHASHLLPQGAIGVARPGAGPLGIAP
jgi:hypothetical protein